MTATVVQSGMPSSRWPARPTTNDSPCATAAQAPSRPCSSAPICVKSSAGRNSRTHTLEIARVLLLLSRPSHAAVENNQQHRQARLKRRRKRRQQTRRSTHGVVADRDEMRRHVSQRKSRANQWLPNLEPCTDDVDRFQFCAVQGRHGLQRRTIMYCSIGSRLALELSVF